MKFDEVKSQVLDGRKKICLVSEKNGTDTMEKRKIYLYAENGEVYWTAFEEIHEEKPVESTDMLFVSNAVTKREGSIAESGFRNITAEDFVECIKLEKEEVISADCGEYNKPV